MNHDPLCPWRQAEESDGHDPAHGLREQAIRDAANEAALALIAMDGIEFTPEQHNSVIDAIHALLKEKP